MGALLTFSAPTTITYHSTKWCQKHIIYYSKFHKMNILINTQKYYVGLQAPNIELQGEW